MSAHGSLDFGYPWWLTYGHVTILLPALLLLGAGLLLRWRPGWLLAFGVISAWALTSMLALQSVGINTRAPLPTPHFFTGGQGRVLDLGAGTGRSSIMLLEARPQATLVALDLFGDSFAHHFGAGQSPQDRLMANLKAAGVADRATIQTADMRTLPFANDSFDALISAYAVDHLPRSGVPVALAEAHRVLKPGGDFLLMLVANDAWVKFAYGPLLSHGGTRGAAWWTARAQEAGFTIAEQGTSPATLYFVLRRPARLSLDERLRHSRNSRCLLFGAA